MSSCCDIPHPEGSFDEQGYRADESICPTCGRKGEPVTGQTIRSLTRRTWKHYAEITDGYLCLNPDDSTIYYFPSSASTIEKKDVVDRVGIKETEEPIYVCYCFRHTKSEIESDFLTHGRSTIEDDIRQKVKSKLCGCEVANPSGKCCLGNVRKTYKHLQKKAVSEEVMTGG